MQSFRARHILLLLFLVVVCAIATRISKAPASTPVLSSVSGLNTDGVALGMSRDDVKRIRGAPPRVYTTSNTINWSYPNTSVSFEKGSNGSEVVALAIGKELRVGPEVLVKLGDTPGAVSKRLKFLGKPEFDDDWDADSGEFYLRYLYRGQLIVEFWNGELVRVTLHKISIPSASSTSTRSPETLE